MADLTRLCGSDSDCVKAASAGWPIRLFYVLIYYQCAIGQAPAVPVTLAIEFKRLAPETAVAGQDFKAGHAHAIQRCADGGRGEVVTPRAAVLVRHGPQRLQRQLVLPHDLLLPGSAVLLE